jgi:hypothetical protein
MRKKLELKQLNFVVTSSDNTLITLEQSNSDGNQVDLDLSGLSSNLSAKDSAISANTGSISAEVTRAEGAEGVLDTKIDQEIADRGAADTNLQNAIDTEASTARAAESALDDKIDQEIIDRQNAITSALASEMTFRGGFIPVDLSNAIKNNQELPGNQGMGTGDVFVATAAGLMFTDNIELEIGDMLIVNEPVKNLDSAASWDSSKFTIIQKNISDTVTKTYVDDADTVNANAITAETSRAQAAEQANTNAITAEVSRAEGAEGDLSFDLPGSSAVSLTEAINEVAQVATGGAGYDYYQSFTPSAEVLAKFAAKDASVGGDDKPFIAWKATSVDSSLKGNDQVIFDEVFKSFFSTNEKLSKICITLNGLELQGEVGGLVQSVSGSVDYNAARNASGDLEIYFSEGLLDSDDVIGVKLARGS